MGLSSKCFEILENRPSNYDLRQNSDGSQNNADGSNNNASHNGYGHDPLMSDDESEATEDEDEDDDMDDGANGGAGDETESETSEDAGNQSDAESFLQDAQRGPKLRVREILFYEERVEAFRRRHGVLRP